MFRSVLVHYVQHCQRCSPRPGCAHSAWRLPQRRAPPPPGDPLTSDLVSRALFLLTASQFPRTLGLFPERRRQHLQQGPLRGPLFKSLSRCCLLPSEHDHKLSPSHQRTRRASDHRRIRVTLKGPSFFITNVLVQLWETGNFLNVPLIPIVPTGAILASRP